MSEQKHIPQLMYRVECISNPLQEWQSEPIRRLSYCCFCVQVGCCRCAIPTQQWLAFAQNLGIGGTTDSHRSASCRVVFLRLVAEKHSNKPLCRFGDHVVNRNAAHNFLDTQVLSFSTRPPTSAHAQTHSHTNLGTHTLIITATEKQHHEQKRPPCWKGEAHKTLTFSQRQRTRKRPRVCVCVCIYFCLCIRCVVDNAAHRTKEATRKE